MPRRDAICMISHEIASNISKFHLVFVSSLTVCTHGPHSRVTCSHARYRRHVYATVRPPSRSLTGLTFANGRSQPHDDRCPRMCLNFFSFYFYASQIFCTYFLAREEREAPRAGRPQDGASVSSTATSVALFSKERTKHIDKQINRWRTPPFATCGQLKNRRATPTVDTTARA